MTNAASASTTDDIRQLNDNFRTTFRGGRVLMTAGVSDCLPKPRPPCSRRFSPSTNSMRTTTRIASTTSAASRSKAKPTFGRSTTTPPTCAAVRKTRRSGNDARAHHHARRRVLTPNQNRKEASNGQPATYLSCLHRHQTREGQDDFWLAIGAAFHAPGWRRVQRRPASVADRVHGNARSCCVRPEATTISRRRRAPIAIDKSGSRRR